ncbi:host-nuclease inhibitor Gam family protein, partial [Escherichia coli]
MNAYYIQDRLEAQSWARYYQQIAREEKVSTPRLLAVF